MDAADGVDFEAALRAGLAVYNAGEHHAAHDAWEDRWLGLDEGADDERLLHGLIQFTAAVYHARRGNWSGATGLAESGAGYLDGLPATYRGLDVAGVRSSLDALAADPERVERGRPPRLEHRGETVTPGDLSLDALGVAAGVVAEEYGYDGDVVADAVRYAGDESIPGRDRFRALLADFVREQERRGLIATRLDGHVERRRRRERDVDGLFE